MYELVGGIIGFNDGNISNSVSYVTINAVSTNYKCFVGGIVGYNEGVMVDSTNEGIITAKGYTDSYTFVDELIGCNLKI